MASLKCFLFWIHYVAPWHSSIHISSLRRGSLILVKKCVILTSSHVSRKDWPAKINTGNNWKLKIIYFANLSFKERKSTGGNICLRFGWEIYIAVFGLENWERKEIFFWNGRWKCEPKKIRFKKMCKGVHWKGGEAKVTRASLRQLLQVHVRLGLWKKIN